MKRLERLGSIAFLTITICFVFHLIAMSFNVWIKNNCQNCDENNLWTNWNTALRSRCYQTSVGSISSSNKTGQSFLTEICLPNQFLSAKNADSAEYCLLKAINQTHTICSLRNYDENRCECHYRTRTKLILAMTILTTFSLAALLVFSHIISFTKLNYILRWLFPVCFILLIVIIVCILVTLATFSITRYDDIEQLIYTSALIQDAFPNGTMTNDWNIYLNNTQRNQYSAKVGWCFGMEILSLQFAVVTLILYILMTMAKNRPEPEN